MLETDDAARTRRKNAMYGPCAGCGQPLAPGDPIAFVKGRFWCRACADEAETDSGRPIAKKVVAVR